MWKRAFKVLAPLSCLWEYSYDNRKYGGSYRKFNSTKAEMGDAVAGYFSGMPWSPPVLCWKMEVRTALLLTGGFCGLGWGIDMVLILLGRLEDSEGRGLI